MTSKLIGIVALTAALAPGTGNAIGLGELSLQSRIGESLRAELPILVKEGESPGTACFSLAPMPGSDLPVITAAKTRLIRRGQAYILQIFGSRPISEPIFALAVQAGCGYDVTRDYLVMPEAPFMLAEASPSADLPPVTPGKPGKLNEWHARDGDTLEDIADAQGPQSLAERQRLLAALKRANPDLSPEIPLNAGDVVRIPKRNRSSGIAKEATSRPASVSPDTPQKKPSPPRPKTKPMAPATARGIDQVRLGAAPEDIAPGSGPASEAATRNSAEERILRLETTLHLLTQEIEKMDKALELTSQAIAAQEKLKLAETLPTPRQTEGPTISAAPVASQAQQKTNWLELLLSAGLGAAITIGLAQYFGRRQSSPGTDQIPLALTTPHTIPEPVKENAAEAVKTGVVFSIVDTTTPTPMPAASPPMPVQPRQEESLAPASEPGIVDITIEDEYSVIELAEIMLAFGRVRGAADTLAEYVDENLPKSIQPWSMLLDLYRRGGMRQEFEALAEKMHSRFNASIPVWSDSSTPISGLKDLEDYPHIVQQTSSQWGTQACLDYLLGLISDTRAGQRNGFPLEVVEEIVLLMRILEQGYGCTRPA